MGIVIVILLEQLVPVNISFQLRDACGQRLQLGWNTEHSKLSVHHTSE